MLFILKKKWKKVILEEFYSKSGFLKIHNSHYTKCILQHYSVLYHYYSLHGEFQSECAIKYASYVCYTCFDWSLDFLQKNLGISKIFVSIEMKIKLKSILTSALFQSLFDLEPAIEIRQVHKRFIKLPITLLFWHDMLYNFWT